MWTALLTSRRREHQLLTVSAGVGMIVTGWAVSFGLRELFPSAFSWTDLFAAVANVAGILLWCLAFRPAARRSAPARALMNPS
ncbi:MAG TPA: hypothetical protein VFW83_01825, partial [Bryobacteraceae bacterium]|nr:hypothetical protein [Bryobacteraceae bacterium]